MQPTTRTNSLLILLAALASIAALAILRDVLEPLMIAIFLSFVAMPVVRAGRRLGLPGPLVVTAVITFLLGPEAGFVHGAVWYVDGGSDAMTRPDRF